jgi:hypothetical protein
LTQLDTKVEPQQWDDNRSREQGLQIVGETSAVNQTEHTSEYRAVMTPQWGLAPVPDGDVLDSCSHDGHRNQELDQAARYR